MINNALFRVVTFCLLGVVADTGAAQPPWTPLEDQLDIALQGADIAVVRERVKAGANVNARDVLGGNALHVAANFRGDLEVLKLLLDRGADLHAVNQDGQTPLMLALQHAHYRHEGQGERLVRVASLLLSRGAKVSGAGTGGRLPLRAAMDPVNLPLIELLLKHGAAVPDDGLDWAISNQYTDLIRLLMPRATPVMLSWPGPTGGTLLHRAAESPDTAFVVTWLLGKGLRVDAPDQSGTTPLGHAALAGNLAGVVQLHSAKARLDRIDDDGQTALHLAAYGAHLDVLQWLVRRGLDIKCATSAAARRWTLHWTLDRLPSSPRPQARAHCLAGRRARRCATRPLQQPPLACRSPRAGPRQGRALAGIRCQPEPQGRVGQHTLVLGHRRVQPLFSPRPPSRRGERSCCPC